MTRGTQHQPKALHLGSFSVCFRSSVDKAAAPADNPATETILGFSGDVTEISKAAGLPRAQLGSKMSAGREWSCSDVRLLPSHLYAQVGSMASLRQRIVQLVVVGDYVSSFYCML